MNKVQIQLNVNGEEKSLLVSPEKTLLELLREDMDLTGSKRGCGIGECGACTVIMDGKAVNSCLVLAPQANGSEVWTVEGLTNAGQLDPLQQAFIDNHAIQCGFCTPGMLMSAKALLLANPKPSAEAIKEAISGNLCRCTGYQTIIKAIEQAGGEKHVNLD